MPETPDLANAPQDEDTGTYAGPEELVEAKRLLESVIDSLGGMLQGRLMSAIDDIEFVMGAFVMTPEEIAESDAEEEHSVQ